MRQVCLSALGILTLVIWSPAQLSGLVEIARDHRWPQKVLARTLIVQNSSFDRSSLERLFSRALASEARTYPIIKIEAFTDRRTEIDNRKGGTDTEYLGWRFLFDENKKNIPPSAQFISINGNAAMKLRNKSGQVYEKVISGKDPRVLTIRGTRFRLADIIPGTIRMGREAREEVAVTFYYWTSDSYDEERVRELLEEHIAATGLQHIAVSVEPWPWFILDDEFPILYPYIRVSNPPSQQDYYSSYRVTCSSVFGTLQCWHYGRKP